MPLPTKAKVLIIDDSLTVVKSLAKILRQAELEPIECTDATQAISLALQHLPDLILLDLVMPDTPGIRLLREIREQRDLAPRPVMVITAVTDEQNIIHALEEGADDYVSKPFTAPVLLARIHTHLRSWQLLQDLEDANRELRDARDREVSAERWKTAVEMAGAAAHTLNQPLTSIVCYADILLKKFAKDHEDYRAIECIAQESERMAMTLRKMAELTKLRTSEYVGSTTIIDLKRSFEKTNPGMKLSDLEALALQQETLQQESGEEPIMEAQSDDITKDDDDSDW